MTTVGQELDRLQGRLHDNGTLWTRAELLRHWNDGYRELCALSQAVRRLRLLDLPGRHTWAITQDWEDSALSGTVRKGTRQLTDRQGTGTWEAEALADVSPTASFAAITQEWERAASGEPDSHYRFYFPRNHDRVVTILWHDQPLVPIAVRELDETVSAWQRRIGRPEYWTIGTGRINTVELYEIETTYGQAYDLRDRDAGIPRGFAGSRGWAALVLRPEWPVNAYAYTSPGDADALTRAAPPLVPGLGVRITTLSSAGAGCTQPWEADLLDGATPLRVGQVQGGFSWEEAFGAVAMPLGVGAIRAVTSPDRQYLPLADDATPTPYAGGIRDWRSSTEALLVVEVVLPAVALDEPAIPTRLPGPLLKYVRYYVWAQAFGHAGEGHQTILADHYTRRFLRGVALFRRLGDVAHRDRVFVREPVMAPPRPARVTLPPQFPAVF